MNGRTDTASRTVAAAPAMVYGAFLDPDALMSWLPPKGMSGRLLRFEPHEGGRYRIELCYKSAAPAGGAGKSGARSDISNGRFVTLEPGRRIVQSVAFESGDPAFAGEMIMIWTFEPRDGGTQVTVTAENVPSGISAEDHAAGLSSSLDNLARFVSG